MDIVGYQIVLSMMEYPVVRIFSAQNVIKTIFLMSFWSVLL